jgi:hypothetical protein
LEEFGNGKGKLANASEEGQGPRRAVEPMMMMMMMISEDYVGKGKLSMNFQYTEWPLKKCPHFG